MNTIDLLLFLEEYSVSGRLKSIFNSHTFLKTNPILFPPSYESFKRELYGGNLKADVFLISALIEGNLTFEFFKIIKKTNPKAKIITQLSNQTRLFKDAAIESGADFVIMTPFKAKTLVDLVHQTETEKYLADESYIKGFVDGVSGNIDECREFLFKKIELHSDLTVEFPYLFLPGSSDGVRIYFDKDGIFYLTPKSGEAEEIKKKIERLRLPILFE